MKLLANELLRYLLKMIIKSQDEQLSTIGTSVQALKNMSNQIGLELDEQSVLVNTFLVVRSSSSLAERENQMQSRCNCPTFYIVYPKLLPSSAGWVMNMSHHASLTN